MDFFLSPPLLHLWVHPASCESFHRVLSTLLFSVKDKAHLYVTQLPRLSVPEALGFQLTVCISLLTAAGPPRAHSVGSFAQGKM